MKIIGNVTSHLLEKLALEYHEFWKCINVITDVIGSVTLLSNEMIYYLAKEKNSGRKLGRRVRGN